jgi:ABC-type bacteriocin/lantibiotic exporter with double-glycine peptidase domain
MRDEINKKAHEASTRLACEAAGSIRTIAALTREDSCCALYRECLQETLQRSYRFSIWSAGLFSLAESMVYFIIALIFWYGSRLVSFQEYTITQFFVAVMVGVLFLKGVFILILRLPPEYDLGRCTGRDYLSIHPRHFFNEECSLRCCEID